MKVIERSDDPQRFADMVDPEKNIIPQLGILVVEVDEKTQDLLPGLRHTYGLVIAAESSDSPVFRRKPEGGRRHLRGESRSGSHHPGRDVDAGRPEIRRPGGDSGGA